MVLIISNKFDLSTSRVMEWINYSNKSSIRMNLHQVVDAEDLSLEINNEQKTNLQSKRLTSAFKNETCKALWIRRLTTIKHSIPTLTTANDNLQREVSSYLKKEMAAFHLSILKTLKYPKTLLAYNENIAINKLYALQLACESSLKIPATILTNSKKELQAFKDNYQTIITKPISDPTTIMHDSKQLVFYTEQITDGILAKESDEIFPCFAQKYIEKEYEVRTFYLEGKCHSMAIFSQMHQDTKVDFRRYQKEVPNRNVPYQLPKELEEKIDQYMKALKLNTGSIDFIKSKDGDYIFLEVNPAGQFGMISFPCNYFLHEKIANYLIN